MDQREAACPPWRQLIPVTGLSGCAAHPVAPTGPDRVSAGHPGWQCFMILIKTSQHVDGRDPYCWGAPADVGIPGEKAFNQAFGSGSQSQSVSPMLEGISRRKWTICGLRTRPTDKHRAEGECWQARSPEVTPPSDLGGRARRPSVLPWLSNRLGARAAARRDQERRSIVVPMIFMLINDGLVGASLDIRGSMRPPIATAVAL